MASLQVSNMGGKLAYLWTCCLRCLWDSGAGRIWEARIQEQNLSDHIDAVSSEEAGGEIQLMCKKSND